MGRVRRQKGGKGWGRVPLRLYYEVKRGHGRKRETFSASRLKKSHQKPLRKTGPEGSLPKKTASPVEGRDGGCEVKGRRRPGNVLADRKQDSEGRTGAWPKRQTKAPKRQGGDRRKSWAIAGGCCPQKETGVHLGERYRREKKDARPRLGRTSRRMVVKRGNDVKKRKTATPLCRQIVSAGRRPTVTP